MEAALANAKKALESQEVEPLRTAADELARVSHKLAEAMYAKASQPGADGGAAGGDGAGGDANAKPKDKDDVVEAEFEEVKE